MLRFEDLSVGASFRFASGTVWRKATADRADMMPHDTVEAWLPVPPDAEVCPIDR